VQHEGELFKKFKEYLASDDLKRQYPRPGDYVDYVKKQGGRELDEQIEFKCSITFLGEGASAD